MATIKATTSTAQFQLERTSFGLVFVDRAIIALSGRTLVDAIALAREYIRENPEVKAVRITPHPKHFRFNQVEITEGAPEVERVTAARAKEIIRQAKESAKSSYPSNSHMAGMLWINRIDSVISPDENAAIKAVWETLPGEFSFVNTLTYISRGKDNG